MLIFYKKGIRTGIIVLAISILLMLNGCEDRLAPDPGSIHNTPVYALTDANQLVRLTLGSSHDPMPTMRLIGTNIEVGERIMSIDFRPATGQLYGVSNKSRLFIINTTTAEARPLTVDPFTPGITGSIVGIDFNPTFDRIRLISNDDQDFWLNPETGLVMAKNGITHGPMGVMVSELAYTNNRAGVATTALYDIDPATDRLYTQSIQNKGKLTDVGPLGLDITGAAGFDIAPDGNGLVAVTFNGSSELQKVNLLTGRLQKISNLPGTIIGLAIPTEPVAYAVDDENQLLVFNPENPLPVLKTITGLQPTEQINKLAFRPSTGQLYALGVTNHLYTLNTASGVATLVSKSAFSQQLSGNVTDFHFLPAPDRIRLTTDAGMAILLNPIDGSIDAVKPVPDQLINNRTYPSYILRRASDSTRVYTINPLDGSPSAGIVLPGNPIIRSFIPGLGF